MNIFINIWEFDVSFRTRRSVEICIVVFVLLFLSGCSDMIGYNVVICCFYVVCV